MEHGERKKELPNEKSISEPWGNKADQYMCNWSLQSRRERKGDRKNIQGYSGQKFSIVDTNYKSICIGN